MSRIECVDLDALRLADPDGADRLEEFLKGAAVLKRLRDRSKPRVLDQKARDSAMAHEAALQLEAGKKKRRDELDRLFKEPKRGSTQNG